MAQPQIDFGQPVPIFPLPQCVLLPHASVPLHIFEQRYRKMVADALDSNGLIAMATLVPGPGARVDDAPPPIRPCVCIGYLAHHQKLPDGRYNVLLQGLCRAALRREPEHEPYRLGVLEPIEPEAPMEIDLESTRDGLEALLTDSLLRELVSVRAINNCLSGEIPTIAMIDLSILTVCQDTEQRYAMLSETCVHARARWLAAYLQETRKTLSMAKALGCPRTLHGASLN